MVDFLDISKFTKLEKIGEGSFGKVYKVLENITEKNYAAKISITKFDDTDDKFIRNLKREVSILSQLDHPSVLRFIGYSPIDFNQEYNPVIITEYSSNGSLEDIMKLERSSLSPSGWTDTKKLINIYGIAKAMSYLHSHNIIHRDLKPANILEDEQLFPKISDFGLSKIYHQNFESMSSQSSFGFKGTPIYVAPEIWLNKTYTKSSDVYSFSIIVYELLTLEEAFNDYNFFQLYSEVVIKGERPKFNHPINEAYRDLITRCWSNDATKRPTFDEIVYELSTNKKFITPTINVEEYLNYIDEIENLGNSFDPSKKLKDILLNNNFTRHQNSGNKIVTVKEFNNLPLKKQQMMICEILERNPDENTRRNILNINDLLVFLQKFNVKDEYHYFRIIEEDCERNIEEVISDYQGIEVSYDTIEMINERSFIEKNNFLNELKKFKYVLIEIEYPSEQFSNIYEYILNYHKESEYRFHLKINIKNEITTDNQFRNNREIEIIEIYDSVREISGEDLGFGINGGGSFSRCISLKEIIIGVNVEKLCKYCIFGCSSLTKVLIPPSVKIIEEGSFCKCSSLTEISIPSSIKKIEKYAFNGCKSLTQIAFSPTEYLNICEYAFYGCISLEQISIPSHCSVDDYAFSECSSLKQISIHSANSSFGVKVFDKCRTITLSDDMIKIPKSIFNGSYLLTNITIPSSIKEIGQYAFAECFSLKEITIPSSVRTIDDYAFQKCILLENISLPSSLQELGRCVFYECQSLKQFSIPNSLSKIKERTFYKCPSLMHIVIPSSVTSIEKYVFSGCTSLIEITLPCSITEIESYTFKDCTSLKQITIPASVDLINSYAFIGCSSLENVIVSNLNEKGEVEIRKREKRKAINHPFMSYQFGFGFFNDIDEIVVDSSDPMIDDHAFEGCSSLSQIQLPSSIISIGKNTFKDCSSLKQITIPSSVKEIKEGAFEGCSSLNEIMIPPSVTKIGNYAFKGCLSLGKFSIPPSVKSIGENVFEGCTNAK